MNRFYTWYFRRLSIGASPADESLHLLSAEEVRYLRRIELRTQLWAAFWGTVGVLALYLPQYWAPAWFPSAAVNLPFFEKSVAVPWVATIYGVVLVFLEIVALTLLNLRAVHQIAVVVGYLTSTNRDERTKNLLLLGTEQKDKSVLNYGIDPLQGLSTQRVFLFNALIALKATVSNQLVRALLNRFLGRYAGREVLDMAGIPVFAFWNVLAARTVLRQARLVILGQTTIDQALHRFPQVYARHVADDPAEIDLIYDTLQFIAISKRDFHPNHGYLTKRLLDHFGIPPRERHVLRPDYLDRLKTAPAPLSALCRFVIALGFLLDGKLSTRERVRIRRLDRAAVLHESPQELNRWCADFQAGRGVPELMERYLATAEFRNLGHPSTLA
jgi:hypothetical protein